MNDLPDKLNTEVGMSYHVVTSHLTSGCVSQILDGGSNFSLVRCIHIYIILMMSVIIVVLVPIDLSVCL